ncbi:abortive infection family protein [Microcoleus sp. Pol10D4]|uniref:abortive infection family protein n=1 Tax=Microcoleus sp. Pol10D4 TaxID=3055387 RepID=UPI002FD2D1B3
MENLNELIEKHGRWSNLKLQITSISYEIDAGMLEKAIGASKSLLETICKTILDNEQEPYGTGDNVNKLAKKTMKKLDLEQADGMIKFSNSLVSSMQFLGELRNCLDSQSHGRSLSGELPKIDPISAHFLVQSTELIACLLINLYEQKKSLTISSGNENLDNLQELDGLQEFERLQEFNTYLDSNFGDIQVLDITYLISKVLFLVDREAYNNAYSDYLQLINEETN